MSPQDRDLGALDRRFRPALLSFFSRRVRDRSEAEDLTQEVFVRLASSGARIEAVEPYVFRTAANLLRERARRQKVRDDYRTARQHEDGLAVDLLDPFRVAAGREDLARLAGTVAALPERTRTIFILYKIEHIEKQRIADGLGISVRSVEVHVHRALALLHGALEAGS